MSREILEAMSALAREKGISPDKLRHALEDARALRHAVAAIQGH